MNILIYSYFFPPIKAIGAVSIYKLAKAFNDLGHKVFVITTSGYGWQKDYSLYTDTDGIHIYKIPNLDSKLLKPIISSFFRRKDLKPLITQRINNFWRNIFYEGGPIFPVYGFFLGSLLYKKYNIDIVFTSFSPLVNHISGFLLKKFFKKIFWIAHYRDLRVNISSSICEVNREKIIIETADMITAVSEGLLFQLLKIGKPRRTLVISNCIYDIKIDNNISTDRNKLKIVYTGSLYNQKQKVTVLAQAISNLNEKDSIEIIYAGPECENFKHEFELYLDKAFIKSHIHCKGLLTWEESFILQKSSDVLLLLTWSDKNEKGIFTGKLFEYLSHQKPILLIVNGDKDEELEQTWLKGNFGLLVYNELSEKEKVIKFLKYMLDYKKKYGLIKWNFNKSVVNRFECTYQAKKILDAVNLK